MIGRTYHERGQPVVVLKRWRSNLPGGRGPCPACALAPVGKFGPRNVLIERAGGERVVRPFRGLRKPASTSSDRGDTRGSGEHG